MVRALSIDANEALLLSQAAILFLAGEANDPAYGDLSLALMAALLRLSTCRVSSVTHESITKVLLNSLYALHLTHNIRV